MEKKKLQSSRLGKVKQKKKSNMFLFLTCSVTYFSLVFPRWDVISVIFSVFLLTYTYQEGKANYFKGSILILSYIVLIAGFYLIPPFSEHSVLVGIPI